PFGSRVGEDEPTTGDEITRSWNKVRVGRYAYGHHYRQDSNNCSRTERKHRFEHDQPPYRIPAVADASTTSMPPTLAWRAFTVVPAAETVCSLIVSKPPAIGIL